MANVRMHGPDGSVYMIPSEHVKEASQDGLVMAPGVSAPTPEGLRGMQEHPYMDAAANTAGSLFGGVAAGLTNSGRGLLNAMATGRGQVSRGPASTPTPDEMPAYMGEQAAEFMLPEAALGKLAEGVKGAQMLGRFASPLARLTRIGGEAAVSGGVNAMQGKDFTQGAELGAASEFGGQVIGGALKGFGTKTLNTALNISGSKLRRTNPAAFMLENGGFGFRGVNGMRSAADDMAKDVYQQISDVTQNSSARINLQPMRDVGNNRVQQFMSQQNPNLVAQADNVMDTANNVTLPIMGTPLTVPRNAQVPMTAAMDVKRGLGAARSWNGNNFFEPPVTSMRDAMYGTLNEAMNTAHPELRGLNNTYSNAATIADSIDRKSSLWPTLVAAGMGGVAGGSHGGGVAGALSAIGTGLLYHGVTSAPAGYAAGRLGVGAPTMFNFAKDAYLGSQQPTSDNQGTNTF